MNARWPKVRVAAARWLGLPQISPYRFERVKSLSARERLAHARYLSWKIN
jgi:hypothetical protein